MRGGAGDGKRGGEVRRGGGSGEFRNLERGASATGMRSAAKNFWVAMPTSGT